MAILNKLYEIAETIWQKMTRKVQGSFRANEITKNLGEAFCWGEDIDFNQPFHVEVGSFSCEFTASYIFHFVSKFESIAGIGKNAHQFVFQMENSKEIGSVCFQATKNMVELCDFVCKNSCIKSMMSILIDAEKNRLVATDSHKILAMPITITKKSGDTNNLLINAKAWKKMCAKMKEGKTYKLEAVKLNDCEETTALEFEGLTSYEPFSGRFPNWASCLGKIYDGYCACLGDSWQAIRKMIRSCNNEEYVYLSGKNGEKYIQVKVGENVATFATDEVLKHSFSLCFGCEHLLAIPQMDILYLGTEAQTPKMAECKNGNVYVLCPYKDGDSYIGEKVADGVYDAGKPGKGMKLLQQGCETTPAVLEKKAASSSEKKVPSSCTKKADADSRKFAFEKIGIQPGSVITFIHGGQKVITTADNKVEYHGKVYTLSGFCKEFMPDDRRNKANSYRGCAFFAYDGVKLEKMFKEALKAKEHVFLAQDKKEKEKEIKRPSASVPAPIVKMDVAELLASLSHTSDSKSVCSYLASLPTIVPSEQNKGVGARKIHHLVGVTAQPMSPPVDERIFSPYRARGQ